MLSRVVVILNATATCYFETFYMAEPRGSCS
jgi:hypothetical protein